MTYSDEYLKWLRQNIDSYRNEDGDIVPPWEKYPTYERYTIGWRMGNGESYLSVWRYSIEKMPTDFSLRLEYLRRHRPAPINWGDMVLPVLYSDQESDEEFGCSESEIAKLLELGVIEHDVAFQTWLDQQTRIVWPWELSDSPISGARYRTREFWFFSRQIEQLRSSNEDLNIAEPSSNQWREHAELVKTGKFEAANPEEGLLTLAKMLCAGDVIPPWELGLKPVDFHDSFEDDMNYVDAYRLWMMNAFDDNKLLNQMLRGYGIPPEWEQWVEEQSSFG